ADRAEQPHQGRCLARAAAGQLAEDAEPVLSRIHPHAVLAGEQRQERPCAGAPAQDREGSLLVRRRLFWIIAIVLLGITVHLAYVLFVPNMEMNRIMSAAAENH